MYVMCTVYGGMLTLTKLLCLKAIIISSYVYTDSSRYHTTSKAISNSAVNLTNLDGGQS